MVASGIGVGLGVELGKCNRGLGELGMNIANQGTCQTWHDLAYLPRGPREPNAPRRAKSRQLTCHLPDALEAGYYPTHKTPLLGTQDWSTLTSTTVTAIGRGYACLHSEQTEEFAEIA